MFTLKNATYTVTYDEAFSLYRVEVRSRWSNGATTLILVDTASAVSVATVAAAVQIVQSNQYDEANP